MMTKVPPPGVYLSDGTFLLYIGGGYLARLLSLIDISEKILGT